MALFLIGNGLAPFKIMQWCKLTTKLTNTDYMCNNEKQYEDSLERLDKFDKSSKFDPSNPKMQKYTYFDLSLQCVCMYLTGEPAGPKTCNEPLPWCPC